MFFIIMSSVACFAAGAFVIHVHILAVSLSSLFPTRKDCIYRSTIDFKVGCSVEILEISKAEWLHSKETAEMHSLPSNCLVRLYEQSVE